jgi:hypothetical protein
VGDFFGDAFLQLIGGLFYFPIHSLHVRLLARRLASEREVVIRAYLQRPTDKQAARGRLRLRPYAVEAEWWPWPHALRRQPLSLHLLEGDPQAVPMGNSRGREVTADAWLARLDDDTTVHVLLEPPYDEEFSPLLSAATQPRVDSGSSGSS